MKPIYFLSAVVCSVFISVAGFAQTDYYWTNPLGGVFSQSDNWNPSGMPQPSDRAVFDLAHTYTVSFDNGYTNNWLFVDGGHVAFDLSSYTYSLEHDGPGDDSVVIGHIGSARLAISNGTVESRSCVVGRNWGSTGELVVSSDGHWVAKKPDHWQPIWIAHGGEGRLIIQNGGEVRQGHGAAAAQSTANALISVGGVDSQWYVDGYFALAYQGRAELTVTDSAFARIGRCEMAVNPGSTATVYIGDNVSGTPTKWHLTSSWETSLTIGQQGSAIVEVRSDGILLNEGDLALAAYPGSYGGLMVSDSSVTVGRWVSVAGLIDAPGGRGAIELGSGSDLNLGSQPDDNLVVWQNGTVQMTEAVISFNNPSGSVLLRRGTLAGAGLIVGNVKNHSGTVAPGANAGASSRTLEVSGDYIQDTGGSLTVELGGAAEDSDYSRLYVSDGGTATIAGLLHVSLADGFLPESGDSFLIIDAPDGINGSFANAPIRYTSDSGAFDVVYSGTEVILTNFSPESVCIDRPNSDLNDDCRVDYRDFATMANEWLDCGLHPFSDCPQ